MENKSTDFLLTPPHFQPQLNYVYTYSQWAQPQFNWALKFLDKIDLSHASHIVDMGCREGSTTLEIARRYPGSHVIGIDNSASFLELANEHLAKHVVPNVEFRFQDPVQMDFQEKIDAIVSFSMFHWIEDKLAALKAIYRSLKNGGKAYLLFYADAQRERFDDCLNTVMQYPKWQDYFSHKPKELKDIRLASLIPLIDASGLAVKRLEFVDIEDIFATEEQFVNWFTTWFQELKFLPEDLHVSFLQEVVAKYLEKHPADAHGNYHRYDYLLELELFKPAIRDQIF